MKTIITLTFLLFSLSSFAAPFETPQGQYEYESSTISYVRDVQLFSKAGEVGKTRYETLKKKRYVCRHYPNEMVSCYKFLKNTDDVKIPVPEVVEVVPSFGELERYELEMSNSYEVIYSVFQTVSMPLGDTAGYRLHLRESGEMFIEVFQNGAILRFSYETPKELTLSLQKRKLLDDNHWLEYGVRSIYKQI